MLTLDQGQQDRLLLAKLSTGTAKSLSQLAPAKLPANYAVVGFSNRSSVCAAVAELVRRDLIEETRKGRTVSYSITDAGASRLEAVSCVEEDPALRPYQEAFLLLQILPRDGKTLTEGAANKLSKSVRDDLELTPPLATQLRRKLARQGYLRIENAGRSTYLTLTDEGLSHLAELRHHTGTTFQLTGQALNALLDTATGRHGAAIPRALPALPAARQSVPPADMSQAVYAALVDLTLERHSRDRLVPIFEIRREIARKFGPDAARHDALDQHILNLWKKGRVRLISISDLRMASKDELADSISDSYETLFYMEATDGNRHQ